MLLRRGFASFIGVLLAAMGCGSSVTEPGLTDGDGGARAVGATGATTGGGGEQVAGWRPCSLHEGEDDGKAECRAVERPRLWGADDGTTFTSFAKRLRSRGERRGQIWLLDGGPGSAATYALTPLMESIHRVHPDLDVYALDHRGTGKSGYVGCPEQEAALSPGGALITADEWPACRGYLEVEASDKLAAISTSATARDLAAFIDETRAPGDRVLVWGGSYGTYLAHRYLQLFPEQADGVVLEAVLASTSNSIEYDYWRDAAGRRLLDLCAAETYCASKLPQPQLALATLLDKLEQGHCASLGISRAAAKYFLSYLAFYYPLNTAIPAFIYRLDRCEAGDQSAILAMYNNVFGGDGSFIASDGASFSTVLNMHITLSELFWDEAFTATELDEYFATQAETTLFGYESGPSLWHDYPLWLRYEQPPLKGALAVTDTPMLMLQGGVDLATPPEQAEGLEAAFAGPRQHWVYFPEAAHNVVSGTPLDAAEQDHCGQRLFDAFLSDPQGTLDTTCVGEVRPVTFVGYPALAQYIFGTNDLWENGTAFKGAASPMSERDLARVGARLRQALRRPRRLPARGRAP